MVMCKVLSVQIILLLGVLNYGHAQNIKELRNPLPAELHDIAPSASDSELAETGFAGAVQSGSKYFQDMYAAQVSPDVMEFGHVCETPNDWEQRFERINLESLSQQGKVACDLKFLYAHVPNKDHYEHGHKRGNEHHFIERHEKAHPHEGEFKTKVRWGDKHGGYGEHYWDYNHAGHDGHDGEESQYNEQVVEYTEKPASVSNNGRNRRGTSGDDDVEFINEDSRLRIRNGRESKHGGNYRRLLDHERIRREFRHV